MLLLYLIAKTNIHWETDILAFTLKLKSTKPVFPAFLMDQSNMSIAKIKAKQFYT